MKTIAIAAQKGGTGKTTTTTQLAIALGAKGQRVLVVDLDPQGCATHLIAAGPHPLTAEHLLYDGVPIGEVAGPTTHPGVDLVAGAPKLAVFDLHLAERSGEPYALLKGALSRAAADRWDWALIDCPPGLGMLVANGLVAADALVSPTTPAQLSREAVPRLEATIREARQLHPNLLHLGYLLCRVDRARGASPAALRLAGVRRDLQRLVGRTQLWSTQIGRSPALEEGLGQGSRAAAEYRAAADELVRRMRKLEGRHG